MTPADLAAATGARIDRATEWLPYIVRAMDKYGIDTVPRQAAFLAQIGHESDGLHWLTELWGPTDAQKRYEGRSDLGNTDPGDGYRYRGRGILQITGRYNYGQVSRALGVDFVRNPEMLGMPEFAAMSAAWFWQQHGLNALADAGQFLKLTRRINGGTNGLAQRMALHEAALDALTA